jgi:hypothetical protein
MVRCGGYLCVNRTILLCMPCICIYVYTLIYITGQLFSNYEKDRCVLLLKQNDGYFFLQFLQINKFNGQKYPCFIFLLQPLIQ